MWVPSTVSHTQQAGCSGAGISGGGGGATSSAFQRQIPAAPADPSPLSSVAAASSISLFPSDSCVVCGKSENLSKCSRCRSVLYCCREHQKLDWETHHGICMKLTGGLHDNQQYVTTASQPQLNYTSDFEFLGTQGKISFLNGLNFLGITCSRSIIDFFSRIIGLTYDPEIFVKIDIESFTKEKRNVTILFGIKEDLSRNIILKFDLNLIIFNTKLDFLSSQKFKCTITCATIAVLNRNCDCGTLFKDWVTLSPVFNLY